MGYLLAARRDDAPDARSRFGRPRPHGSRAGSLYAHPSPPADDALRVAVEKALEPFERMWAEHGDLPPTDDRHAWGFNGADLYWGDFRRAAEALAALKAEKK